MIRFFDIRINPKIIEMITYRMVAQIKTLIVVTVPSNIVGPCSDKNARYDNLKPVIKFKKNQAILLIAWFNILLSIT